MNSLDNLAENLFSEPSLSNPRNRHPLDRRPDLRLVRESERTGQSSFTHIPYGNKHIPYNPGLEGTVKALTQEGIFRAKKRLLEYGADLPQDPRTISAGVYSPVGLDGMMRAAYSPKDEEMFLDEGTIPGTERNNLLRKVFSYGKSLGKMFSQYGMKDAGERISEFCDGMLLTLKRRPIGDIIHEYGHHLLKKYGISNVMPIEAEEGLVENFREDVNGVEPGPLKTTYNLYKDRGKRALKNIGANVLDVFRDPLLWGPEYAKAYAEA